jgi:hypothetical protein
MYANIGDEELVEACRKESSSELRSRPDYTSISAALHVVYCRQIQSEILNITLHRDFATEFDQATNWRLRILEKLERWKSLCHRVSDAASRTYTSTSWLHMIYNFSLTMLFRPTRQNAAGPSPEWTVKSCCQACLIFRQFQRHNTISDAWMGLIQQFKCGVALLYCFFITPPEWRTETFTSPEVSQAVRACSVILSLLAEKWSESECLRDTFDIIAAEIPLHELEAAPPERIRPEASSELLNFLNPLRRLVIHRDTIRMIKEMATESFHRPRRPHFDDPPISDLGWGSSIAIDPAQSSAESDRASCTTANIFQPLTPQFFDVDACGNNQQLDLEQLGFPEMFDFDLLS